MSARSPQRRGAALPTALVFLALAAGLAAAAATAGGSAARAARDALQAARVRAAATAAVEATRLGWVTGPAPGAVLETHDTLGGIAVRRVVQGLGATRWLVLVDAATPADAAGRRVRGVRSAVLGGPPGAVEVVAGPAVGWEAPE